MLFGFFCGCRGFCHRTESDLFLFILLHVKFCFIQLSGFIGWPGGHPVSPIGPKNTNLVEDVQILLRLKFPKIQSAVLEESKKSQLIRGRVRHLVFPIGPKNTILVEEVKILHLVKFCKIPLSGFRGEVENVSAIQRSGRPSFVFWWARKTHTCKRTLESCFLSSFVEFHSVEKSKTSQPIRGQGGHLVFLISPKKTISVEGF